MDKPVDKIVGWALVLLASARATRFITSDTLGEWTLVAPAKKWAHRYESTADMQGQVEDAELYGAAIPTPEPRNGWRSKLTYGLDCPFCVGFWIGAVILLGEVTIGRSPLRPLWRFGLAALGLNYLVGHISSRIDG